MQIQHDVSARVFQTTIDGHEARLYYTYPRPGVLDVLSTFVPPELRGRRVGAALVQAAAGHAAAEGLEVEATCWYAAKLLARA